MGRRNRSKRNGWEEDGDDDDGLEQAEIEWLGRRQNSTGKRQRTDDKERVASTAAESQTSNDDGDSPSPTQKLSNGDNAGETANSPERDKIERMKLKKQRKKERRKQKKAEAASAAEATKRSLQESEKASQERQRQEREKKKKIRDAGQRSQPFVTLAKGVKYQDVVVGKGPPVRDRGKVRVSYTLRSKSHATGKILDSSANFGFRLGKGEVIKGWDIGLQNMRVGGVRRLVVPPAAGYGFKKDVGAGRGADLYFQIDLLHVAP